MRIVRGAILGVAATVVLSAAAVPSLTGTWKLNVGKSHWDDKEKPTSILVHVRHNEPNIEVDGTVVNAKEQSDTFRYSGSIDGQEKTVPGGTLRIRRLDANTVESVWRSGDGRYVETSRTTVSGDGKQLTRRVELKRPDGSTRWTEVYDKAG